MIEYANPAEHAALAHTTREAYMEVFPTATVEQRLDALEPGAYVAVTCSPAKGVDETYFAFAKSRSAHRRRSY